MTANDVVWTCYLSQECAMSWRPHDLNSLLRKACRLSSVLRTHIEVWGEWVERDDVHSVSDRHLRQRRRVGGNEIRMIRERLEGMKRKWTEKHSYLYIKNSLLLDSKARAMVFFWKNTTCRRHRALENRESLLKDLRLIKEPTESMAGAIVNLIAGPMTDLEIDSISDLNHVQWLMPRQVQRLVQGLMQRLIGRYDGWFKNRSKSGSSFWLKGRCNVWSKRMFNSIKGRYNDPKTDAKTDSMACWIRSDIGAMADTKTCETAGPKMVQFFLLL